MHDISLYVCCLLPDGLSDPVKFFLHSYSNDWKPSQHWLQYLQHVYVYYTSLSAHSFLPKAQTALPDLWKNKSIETQSAEKRHVLS